MGYFSNILCRVGLSPLVSEAFAHCWNLFWRFFQCRMLQKWRTFVIYTLAVATHSLPQCEMSKCVFDLTEVGYLYALLQ